MAQRFVPSPSVFWALREGRIMKSYVPTHESAAVTLIPDPLGSVPEEMEDLERVLREREGRR